MATDLKFRDVPGLIEHVFGSLSALLPCTSVSLEAWTFVPLEQELKTFLICEHCGNLDWVGLIVL